jgi:hypothetical protein
MKAAFVVMSILGCDDSGASCTPVAQVEEKWQTIAACDAASESHLSRYANVNHPMVVAVCQTANSTALADATEDAAQFEIASRSIGPVPVPQPPRDVERERGIAARAVQLMKDVLPSKQSLKDTVIYPVHVVTDTYSWVARKITN